MKKPTIYVKIISIIKKIRNILISKLKSKIGLMHFNDINSFNYL